MLCHFQLRFVTEEQHFRIIVIAYTRPSPLSHFWVGYRTHIFFQSSNVPTIHAILSPSQKLVWVSWCWQHMSSVGITLKLLLCYWQAIGASNWHPACRFILELLSLIIQRPSELYFGFEMPTAYETHFWHGELRARTWRKTSCRHIAKGYCSGRHNNTKNSLQMLGYITGIKNPFTAKNNQFTVLSM